METSYDICTHKGKHTADYKNINIENLIESYEKTLKNKALLYLDYLDYLWNQKKISKYRLKKDFFYKIYYIKDQNLQIMYGEIKYKFFLGKVDINGLEISLKDIKGVILWRCH